MIAKGTIRKMKVSAGDGDSKVSYTLQLDHEIDMNALIGTTISLHWTGSIYCTDCGKKTKTSFGQGYCYPCFQTGANSSPCIINPELCRAHLGEGRDVAWEQQNHNQPHIVYLTASDVVKVGVTRKTQTFTRWIDQGARETIVLAETPNRFTAGEIEVALKSVLSDRTNWQRMLKNEFDDSIDLVEEKGKAEDLLPFDLRDFISDDDTVFNFAYPVNEYPSKVKSVGFEKQAIVSGILKGIKGQYLIFQNDEVINLRKFTSYEIEFNYH
jgi:hypothetical protein